MSATLANNDTLATTNTSSLGGACCSSLRPTQLIKESKRQAERSPCSYILGLCTTLLTVITASTMQSLLGASPVVFLRQAEDGIGQIDMRLTGRNNARLNFSSMHVNTKATGETDILNHMSPRFDLELNAKVITVVPDASNAPRLFYKGVYFLAVDTIRDKNAGIGRSWSLPPLKPGEIWITEKLATLLTLVPGDFIDVEFNVYNLLSRYITLNDDMTDLYSVPYLVKTDVKNATTNLNSTITTVKYKCQGYSEKNGPKPRIDDALLKGTVATTCSPGNREILFCGNIKDGSRCGMANRAMVRLKISDVVSNWHGRIATSASGEGDDEDGDGGGGDSGGGAAASSSISAMIVVEIPHIMEMVMGALPPRVQELFHSAIDRRMASGVTSGVTSGVASGATTTTALRSANMQEMSYDAISEVLVNLPKTRRNAILLQDDYVAIQEGMVQYSGRVLSAIGANWLRVENPILQYLRSQRFTTLYLGMVMDILIAILLGLSSVLIYSLMMINVQGRQFELAVRRMLGATKIQVVALLGVQSMSFAIPSVVIGLPVAHFFTQYLFQGFNRIAGVTIVGGLSGTGAMYGVVLGLCIPMFGAVGPIQKALGVELRESLDVTRSKTKVIEYKIESEQDRSRISPEILAVGGSLSVFGFSVYYLLPLALLSLDLRLFFLLFVALLLGMLVGLVLLASNLQGLIEQGVGFVFLCWTKKVLRTLALKNLIAHRKRNWKTSIMYSLSLAFIIFIAVAAQMQFQTFQFSKLRDAGTSIVVLSGQQGVRQYTNAPSISVSEFRIIRKALMADANVQDVAWVTSECTNNIKVSNVGETFSVRPIRVQTVSPNYFDVGALEFYKLESQFLTSTSKTSALTLGEQLYTARGSQSIILPTSMRNALNYNAFQADQPVAPMQVSVEDYTTQPFPTTTSMQLKPMAYLDSAPGLRFTPLFGRASRQDALVAPATFLQLSQGEYNSIENLPIRRILVQVKNEPTADSYKRLKQSVVDASETVFPAIGITMWSLQDDAGSITQTLAIIDFFFVAITLVGLLLCFFSLVASMVSNIHEQSQDIAIVRSMGLTKRQVVMVYVFEAFVLVLSSAGLGMGVGFVIAWTFSSQQNLFTQLPLTFYFPWPIVLTVIVTAIVCACLAAGLPSWRLVQLRITELLRKFGS